MKTNYKILATLIFGFVIALPGVGCALHQNDIPIVSYHGERFFSTDYGSIRDQKTGLEWFVGPEKKTFVKDAQVFVKTLRAGDYDDWRMPDMTELETLYKSGEGRVKIHNIFKTKGEMVWSKNRSIFGYHYLRLVNGSTGYDTLGRRKHGYRVFAVRNW